MKKITSVENSDNLLCPGGEVSCGRLNEIIRLRNEIDSLTELVRTDALTGLYNFRFFKETIALEMERTRRSTQPLSMILLDIDHFKKFNDKWGHETGNHALVHVANLIKLAIRRLDIGCRFGGEEFVILLPNTDLRQAVSVAERLREMIESTAVEIDDCDESIPLTASLGVDEFTSLKSETAEIFIHRVDALLYQAKKLGRNRTVFPDSAMVPRTDAVSQEEKVALFGAVDNSQ
ncbi:MAG: GGDEF domain-containing protein [Cellvibrio sp.]